MRTGVTAILSRRREDARAASQMEVETALRFAQASAALIVSGLGSDAGIVSFEHTLEAMRSLTMKGAREGSGPLPD